MLNQITKTLAKGYKSVCEVIDEIILIPGGNQDTTMNRGSITAWQSILTIIFTTTLINACAFIFVVGPQTLVQVVSNAGPTLRRSTLDLDMLAKFQSAEAGIFDRQLTRVKELPRAFDPTTVCSSQRCWEVFLEESRRNQLETAEDAGTAASFESIGLDWAREWAKAQEKANLTERDAWKASEDIAVLSLNRDRHRTRIDEASRNYAKIRLDLQSDISDVLAFHHRFASVAESEKDQLSLQRDGMQAQVEGLEQNLAISINVLESGVLLFIVIALIWLIRRLDNAIKAREGRLQKFRT